MTKRALSGIQATGVMQLGNYLGAIKHWINIQNDYQCFFFIANLHSITIDRTREELRKATLYAAAVYLACGLDPDKVTIFAQSSIKEHAELAWILGCSTPLGWLNRMTQYKDKALNDNFARLGLYSYPVLMAADILLYDADIVPVGEDQKQHLELARDISLHINNRFGKELIKLPEPYIMPITKRIMSLKDHTKKMAKSDPSDLSRINLTDENDLIRKKISKAATDSLSNITYDLTTRPALANLINIYSALGNLSYDEIILKHYNSNFATFKNDLAEVIIHEISPLRQKINDYLNDESYLYETLNKGADKARDIASSKLELIKSFYGLL